MVKIEHLDAIIDELYETYWKLTERKTVTNDRAQQWILEVLSVRSEQVLNNPIRLLSFANFAYTHFTDKVDINEFIPEGEYIDPSDYPKLLYISIHRALLKSDDANIRNALLGFYSISTSELTSFIEFNKNYDLISNSKASAKVSRLINRNGAPLRVIRSAFFNENSDISSVDIHNKEKTLNTVNSQVELDYGQVKRGLRLGVIKSIIFLFITKAIIGIIIEIPYDLFMTGAIIVLPLLVNLVFPPAFIALMALAFKLPSKTNTKAVNNATD